MRDLAAVITMFSFPDMVEIGILNINTLWNDDATIGHNPTIQRVFDRIFIPRHVLTHIPIERLLRYLCSNINPELVSSSHHTIYTFLGIDARLEAVDPGVFNLGVGNDMMGIIIRIEDSTSAVFGFSDDMFIDSGERMGFVYDQMACELNSRGDVRKFFFGNPYATFLYGCIEMVQRETSVVNLISLCNHLRYFLDAEISSD
jgi:hypothetical protein